MKSETLYLTISRGPGFNSPHSPSPLLHLMPAMWAENSVDEEDNFLETSLSSAGPSNSASDTTNPQTNDSSDGDDCAPRRGYAETDM